MIAASPSRPTISVAGVSSRTATLMNRNEEPQISASAISIDRFRCLFTIFITLF